MTSGNKVRPHTCRQPGAPAPGRRAPWRQIVAAATLALLTGLSSCASTSPGESGEPGARGQLHALSSGDTNAHPQHALAPGGNVTIPVETLPRQWNPAHADGTNATNAAVARATDPYLFSYSADGQAHPNPAYLQQLPTTVTDEGVQRITYRLNPQAHWNDGTPIDADTFVATWHARRSSYANDGVGGYENTSTVGYRDIAAIQAGQDSTETPARLVIVELRPGVSFHPVTELFDTLIHPAVGADPSIFNTAFTDGQFRPEWRSGPFTFDHLDRSGGLLTLKRNPTWWGPPPTLDTITFRRMDDAAAIPAFLNGEIDLVGVETASDRAQLAAADDVDIRVGRSLSTTSLVLNAAHPTLADQRVREAVAAALNREQWIKVAYQGLGWTETPPGSVLYLPTQPQARDNLALTNSSDRARQLLTDAGYSLGTDNYFYREGHRLTLPLTEFGDNTMTAALSLTLRNQLRAVGIDLNVEIRPTSEYTRRMLARDYGLTTLTLVATTPSPVTTACQLMCTDSGNNFAAVGTTALDDKLRAIGQIADPRTQSNAINAIEKQWLALRGLIPLAGGPTITAYRSKLANIGPDGFAGTPRDWTKVGWLPE